MCLQPTAAAAAAADVVACGLSIIPLREDDLVLEEMECVAAKIRVPGRDLHVRTAKLHRKFQPQSFEERFMSLPFFLSVSLSLSRSAKSWSRSVSSATCPARRRKPLSRSSRCCRTRPESGGGQGRSVGRSGDSNQIKKTKQKPSRLEKRNKR